MSKSNDPSSRRDAGYCISTTLRSIGFQKIQEKATELKLDIESPKIKLIGKSDTDILIVSSSQLSWACLTRHHDVTKMGAACAENQDSPAELNQQMPIAKNPKGTRTRDHNARYQRPIYYFFRMRAEFSFPRKKNGH